MSIPTVEQYQGFERALYETQENRKQMLEGIKPALEFSTKLEALYKQQLGIAKQEAAATVAKYTTPGDDGKTYFDHLLENLGMILEFERSVQKALDKREEVGDYALIKEYAAKSRLIDQLKEQYRSQLEEYQKASQVYAYILKREYEEQMKPVNAGNEKTAQLNSILQKESELQGKLGKLRGN